MAERPEVTFKDALCNNALIELRWEQRRRLRMIPVDFVAKVKQEYLDRYARERVVKHFDPRVAELHLRQTLLAGAEAALLEMLSSIEEALLVREMTRVFAQWGATCEHGLLESVSQLLTTTGDDELLDGLWRNSGTDKPLLQFVAMLLLADELANDGYSDSRLSGAKPDEG